MTLRQLILATDTGSNVIHDQFLAQLMATRETIVSQLAEVIDQDDMFLDIFEDEYERFEVGRLFYLSYFLCKIYDGCICAIPLLKFQLRNVRIIAARESENSSGQFGSRTVVAS